VSKRLSPAERLRLEIDEVFAGGENLSGAIERVARLGAQLLVQSALEAEVAAVNYCDVLCQLTAYWALRPRGEIEFESHRGHQMTTPRIHRPHWVIIELSG
jgi:hypothetical protein